MPSRPLSSAPSQRSSNAPAAASLASYAPLSGRGRPACLRAQYVLAIRIARGKATVSSATAQWLARRPPRAAAAPRPLRWARLGQQAAQEVPPLAPPSPADREFRLAHPRLRRGRRMDGPTVFAPTAAPPPRRHWREPQRRERERQGRCRETPAQAVVACALQSACSVRRDGAVRAAARSSPDEMTSRCRPTRIAPARAAGDWRRTRAARRRRPSPEKPLPAQTRLLE
eukprot:scaffold85064_cov33-Tisochrysis_lutea.AAC.4